MFEHCLKCSNIMRCFTCCPNTVLIHSFPCVRTVFKQPAVQWCAVQTLFKQFGLVWQSSNTSNSVRTAHSCPPPVVSPFHFFFLSFFLVCLFTAIHIRPQAHARPSVTRPHAQTSEFFFFLSFSFFFLFFTVIRFHMPACPSARSKHPSKCFFFLFTAIRICMPTWLHAHPHAHTPTRPHVHMSTHPFTRLEPTSQCSFPFSSFLFPFLFTAIRIHTPTCLHAHPHAHMPMLPCGPSTHSHLPPTVCPFYFLFSLSFLFFLFFTGIHVCTHLPHAHPLLQ